MKYIEHIKSIILFLLVALSMTLTFLTWNYKPKYQTIEDIQVEHVALGEQKALNRVVKPYRLLFKGEENFTGTISSAVIDTLMDELSEMEANDLTLINHNLSDDKVNEMLRMPNRMTLFFQADVPIPTFAAMLPFHNTKDIPETTFDRIVIDWSYLSTTSQLQFLFINSDNRTLYRSVVKVDNKTSFKRNFIDQAAKFDNYMEIERPGTKSLYVLMNPTEVVPYTYSVGTISTELLKRILFTDPNIVQRNIESTQSERYTDGMSLMRLDMQNQSIHYVYPPAESLSPIAPSILMKDSMDFLNEHGGITEDYRLAAMNYQKHIIDYQMFFEDLPVYSDTTFTRVSTTWGDNRIFRYRRPYYVFDMNLPDDKAAKELASGPRVIEQIQSNLTTNINDINDLVIGYYLEHDANAELITLEPNWFMLTENGWERLTSEQVGGVEYGLE
ncbi:two-component system activity regulator YycH [Lysinibacillus louembei]|uniref:Two-component system activity regulator YycH n=1 Tax=Lysinibacillus louembei TaxID=1470088 RepID=A0ABZ0S047_9BACI|nr:two-component system activity regulator YycH [Lysinibacillus louembei]WPK13060.1 two-component system activity regulator YycH [Lysinibacillus louembei]